MTNSLIVRLIVQNEGNEGIDRSRALRNASLPLRNCADDSELGVFCYNNP